MLLYAIHACLFPSLPSLMSNPPRPVRPSCPALPCTAVSDSLSILYRTPLRRSRSRSRHSVVRRDSPRAFSFKILSRRRGPEGDGGVQHLHSTPLHSAQRILFFNLQYATPPSLVSHESLKLKSITLQETLSPSCSSGYSFFARALPWRRRRRRRRRRATSRPSGCPVAVGCLAARSSL